MEEELSWREVEELMKTWEKHPPMYAELRRISVMIQKKYGFRVQKLGRMKSDEVLGKLAELGIG